MPSDPILTPRLSKASGSATYVGRKRNTAISLSPTLGVCPQPSPSSSADAGTTTASSAKTKKAESTVASSRASRVKARDDKKNGVSKSLEKDGFMLVDDGAGKGQDSGGDESNSEGEKDEEGRKESEDPLVDSEDELGARVCVSGPCNGISISNV